MNIESENFIIKGGQVFHKCSKKKRGICSFRTDTSGITMLACRDCDFIWISISEFISEILKVNYGETIVENFLQKTSK